MPALSGYKTYAACAAGILFAVYGYVWDGMSLRDAAEIVLVALMGGGLRDAIAKQGSRS